MKNFVLLGCLALSSFTGSQAAEEFTESDVLQAIDNICGDTWCEGDFRFSFQNVILDRASNSTQVNFIMYTQHDESEEFLLDVTPPGSTSFQGGIKTQKYDVSCTIKGYSSPSTILQNKYSLNWDFYTVLTDCVQALEGRLSKHHIR